MKSMMPHGITGLERVNTSRGVILNKLLHTWVEAVMKIKLLMKIIKFKVGGLKHTSVCVLKEFFAYL
jgi:hypothetical protein